MFLKKQLIKKEMNMKKFIMILLGCLPMMLQAQNARYCKSYSDFVANRWTPIESLTEGKTKQMCQIKFEDDQFKFSTGDKEADAILKKDVLVVEYMGHLYVNCRNLRCNDIVLDVTNYAQAYRYEGNKLCVVAHWINGGALLASIAGDVVSIAAPLPVAVPAGIASDVVWLNMDKFNSYRCYYLDQDANSKGKTEVVRINDEFLEKVLANDHALLERYNAVEKKNARQSAANILPVLKEKGLIKG